MVGVGSIVMMVNHKSQTSSPSYDVSSEEEEVSMEVGNLERTVASSIENKGAAVQFLPMSQKNLSKINGKWEITKIIDTNGNALFDKYAQGEENKELVVDFLMTNTSTVRVDNRIDYKVSLLTDSGTIALFKATGKGYEIVEARKIIKKNESVAQEESFELSLDKALNPQKSAEVMIGEKVYGTVTVNKASIQDLRVEIARNTNLAQTLEIGFAELNDGGQFEAEVDGQNVTGVFTANGQDGYRITFASGPMAGAMLNFIKKDLQAEKELEVTQNEDQVEVAVEAQDQVQQERRDLASQNIEQVQPVELQSAEEMKQTVQESGFQF